MEMPTCEPYQFGVKHIYCLLEFLGIVCMKIEYSILSVILCKRNINHKVDSTGGRPFVMKNVIHTKRTVIIYDTF